MAYFPEMSGASLTFVGFVYGSILLPLMLLTTEAKNNKKNYLRGIAGFTDQRTAFTRAQGTILQSRDFNLCVERARKILIHEANISKTDPVTPLF